MTLLDIMDAELSRIVPPKKTRTELVIDYFKSHPNQWIDGLVFAEFAGAYAWRSRISDARAHGLNIENRQRASMPSGLPLWRWILIVASLSLASDAWDRMIGKNL